MVVKLTAKQEFYVQGLISGLSQREAYKRAYPRTKMKDKTIDEVASKMLKNKKIYTRYAEIMDEHKQKALWTREDAVNTLKWLLNQSIESVKSEKFDKGYVRQGTANAIVSTVKELNELELLYPLKQAQLERIKGKPEGETTGAIFIESEEEMLRYIENNQHEYDNINK